jgi:hypothetical protein
MDFSLRHRVQTGSGAHPASYPVGTRGSYPEIKRLGREADHSVPSSAEVKNSWCYTSTPQYILKAWCLVKYRDNFTFTFYQYMSRVELDTSKFSSDAHHYRLG